MGVNHLLLTPAQQDHFGLKAEHFGTEACVATAGAEADNRGFKHDYACIGVVFLELPCRVQPREAAPDDRDVNLEIFRQGGLDKYAP